MLAHFAFAKAFYLDAIAILPEPRFEGRPTEVRRERGERVIVYASDHDLDPPPPLIAPQAPATSWEWAMIC